MRRYTAGGDYITQWGSAGTGPGAFSAPTGIAIDGDDNIYVADTGNARIQKCTSAGVYVAEWPAGAGAVGVATDASGNVYVVDRQVATRTEVQRRRRARDRLGPGGHRRRPVHHARGAHRGHADRVLVTDTGNDRISIFSTPGVFTTAFGTSGTGNADFEAPSAITSDCRTNVYVLDTGNSGVKKLGPPGTQAPCPALARAAALTSVTSAARTSASSATDPRRARGATRTSASAAARPPRFSATMTSTGSTAGRVSAAGGLTRERGAGAVGRFSGRLVGRATSSTRAFRAFARGTWRARFDIVTDPRTGKSTAEGVGLVTSSRRRAGQLCLGFSLKVAVAGTKVTTTGTFETLGGSASARTLRARGSFTQTLGASEAFALRGSGAPGGGRSAGRALPASCRTLR